MSYLDLSEAKAFRLMLAQLKLSPGCQLAITSGVTNNQSCIPSCNDYLLFLEPYLQMNTRS